MHGFVIVLQELPLYPSKQEQISLLLLLNLQLPLFEQFCKQSLMSKLELIILFITFTSTAYRFISWVELEDKLALLLLLMKLNNKSTRKLLETKEVLLVVVVDVVELKNVVEIAETKVLV
jgi:hypothetical protein